MKTYTVICKKDSQSLSIKNYLQEQLNTFMEENKENPDIVISVGGDGTMLLSVQRYKHILETVSFVGIHTGTLGFLTDYESHEVDDFLKDLKQGECCIFKRHMLKVTTNKETYFALNEFRVENNMRSQVLDVFINQEFFETFRGNGLCVSTDSGSTAYNKSLGGAVVYSEEGLMQLAEIAGIHHNAYRSLGSSLVLDRNFTIRIESQDFENAVLGIDHLVYDLKDVEYIDISLYPRPARFAQFKKVSFIERLRKSFLS